MYRPKNIGWLQLVARFVEPSRSVANLGRTFLLLLKVSAPTSEKCVLDSEKFGLTSARSAWPSQKLPAARNH